MIQQWSFAKIIRLIIGIVLVITAIVTKEYLFMALGFFFIAIALLNIKSNKKDCCNK